MWYELRQHESYRRALRVVKGKALPWLWLLVLALGATGFHPAGGDGASSPSRVVVARPTDLDVWIARRHGLDLETLRSWNPGLEEAGLHDGDALRVPVGLDRLPELPDLGAEWRRGLRGERRVAVTIDCGWVEPGRIERLLGVLERLDCPAAFFVTGILARENPRGLALLAESPHEIHNHSMTHADFTGLEAWEIREELLGLESLLLARHQRRSRPFFRPPYGARDRRVLDAAAEAGFRSVYWTVDSLDWVTSPPATVESVRQRVLERPFERAAGDPDPLDGAILLFHASGPATPEALERLIPELRARGYRPSPLRALLEP